jgi:hypothetical protein
VVDEAPMMPRYALNIMDRKLRELTDIDEHSVESSYCLVGNFVRLFRLTKMALDQVNLSVKFGAQWKYFVHFWLKTNMLANANAQEFAGVLRQLGLGLSNGEND